MFDQADRLRQLVRETVQEHAVLEPGAPLIAVSGARSGVGTSTLALRLARELTQLGKRIVLIDANLQSPQLAEMLDVASPEGLTEVLSGKRSAAEVLHTLGEQLYLLGGTSPSNALPELNHRSLRRFVAEVRSLSPVADLVVIDAGFGMSPWVARLWIAALQILLVTTPESEPVMDSYAAIKMAPWGDVDGKLRPVINRCTDTNLGNRVSQGLSTTCRKFLGMKLLGDASILPTDVRLQQGDTRLSCASPLQRTLRLLAADVLSQSITCQSCRPAQFSASRGQFSQAAALLGGIKPNTC